jgi:hypothetical protein
MKAGRAASAPRYIKREAFPGIVGSPTTDDSVVTTSIRYYPF